MAKKTVATLGRGGAKDITKVIKAVKSKETGSYFFEEKILPVDAVKDYLAK
ncbi:MAG TPA: DUF4295 domain-containing protein [Flavobacteriales bacterium]|jgi:hypothetical protein|nr:DUF4295 domain-containing protein [Flavobacteriales bacterium]